MARKMIGRKLDFSDLDATTRERGAYEMLNFRSETTNSAVHATGVTYSAICLVSSIPVSNLPKIVCKKCVSLVALVYFEG